MHNSILIRPKQKETTPVAKVCKWGKDIILFPPPLKPVPVKEQRKKQTIEESYNTRKKINSSFRRTKNMIVEEMSVANTKRKTRNEYPVLRENEVLHFTFVARLIISLNR